MLELACVVCKTRLPPELHCPNCKRKFPVIDGVPLLVRDPEWHLATTRAALLKQLESDEEKLRELKRLIALGWKRTVALERVAQAVTRDRELARGWLETLTTAVPALPDVPSHVDDKSATGYTRFQRYAISDWSGQPEAEAVNRQIADVVRRSLAGVQGRIAVLGAGTGRLAEEIRGPFEQLTVDLSLPMALLYRQLCRGDVIMHAPTETNLYRIEDVCPPLRLSRPPGAALDFVVADALQLPLCDQSLEAVVSIYFTDVVPLTLLLREVLRVLKPGGAFIHFGPLGYGFYLPDEMWTMEEVRTQLEARGLEIVRDELVPHVFAPLSGQLIATHVNAWSLVARRRP